MKNFFIKYTDGTTKIISGLMEEISASETEVELSDKLDYDKIDYIEYTMNTEDISAGDKGYYIVMEARSEFGIAYFKEREDSETILNQNVVSVYGYKHKDNCRTVIVTGMPYDVVQAVMVKDNKYYLKLRFKINGKVPYENIKLLITDMENPDATYADIARIYRNYQLKNGFRPLKDRLNPELKYSVEAPNVRIRMGWKPVPCEIAEQTKENEPPVFVACTFDDVSKLMDEYKKAGIEKAEFCLVGWNMKGHDGRWPQILPVESSFGGEEGLKKIMQKATEYGYALTNHTNSTDSYSISELFNEEDIALDENGEKSVEAVRWGGGRTYNLCPKRAYEISMQTLPEVRDLGFRGMQYIDVITCTPARECHNPAHPINKKEACEYFDKLFSETKKMFGSVGCEGPWDHSLKECDYTLYVSFFDFTQGTKGLELIDKVIPFWQLIYHGIVPNNTYARTVNYLISENKDDFLKVLEYGGKPQIYYYAQFVSDGTDWIGKGDFHCNTDEERAFSAKKVKETIDIYNTMQYLQYEFMEKHEEISENVFKTTYSDGSEMIVDYNEKTYKLIKGDRR